MSENKTNGKHAWLSSGEELQSEDWWREGEPDGNGDCVSMSGDGGLQDDVCDATQSQNVLITRKPLCKLGLKKETKIYNNIFD